MLTLRPKTLRRLGSFLAVAALVLVLALVVRQREISRQKRVLGEQREQGLALLDVGDYPGALASLGTYLSEAEPGRVERDFEARLAYAVARARIYDTGERHLEQAGRMLRDLADDFPSHPRRTEALHLLMNIAAAGREWTELRRLCDEALDERPQDAHALRMRREAAEQLGDYSAALADTQRLITLAPAGVEEHLWSLRLMARLGAAPQEIITHAIDQSSRYPQDPRYLLVLAAAYQHGGQTQQALVCLNQARQLDPPADDPAAFIVRLAGLLDTFGEHEQARRLYADTLAQPSLDEAARDRIRLLLALRLWQAGDLEGALSAVPAPPAQQRRRNIELYATRILLQFEGGELAQAEQGLAFLGRIAGAADLKAAEKRRAMAWHEALGAAYAPGAMTQRQRLETLHAAWARVADLRDSSAMLAIDRPTGVFLKWIGDRYWEVGEYQEAIVHWRKAADSLPGWADPLLRVAEASMKLGALDQAQGAAKAAAVRLGAGADERARVLLTRLAYERWLAAPSTSDGVQAAALAAAHQRQHPLDPGTLAVHVHMLSLTDPQQSRQLIRQRLERGADAPLRVELARVSRRAQLGLEQELVAQVAHPEAALLRAQMLAESGQAQRGAELLLPPASAGEAPAALPLEWDIAQARFASQIGDEQAAAMWRRLGQANPASAAVQLAILEQVELLAREPEFAAETIERLARITGPTGRRWRLEKARWLLGRRTAAAALEAADLLRMLIRQSGGGIDSVDQRVLLAEAVSLAGALASATEHLQAAYLLDPTRGDVGLRLIALHERAGRADEARRLLGRLAAEGVRGPRHRLEVAQRLAQIAELQVAIALLEQSEAAGELDEAARTYLAELMHRAGRPDDAGAVYADLLLSPTPAPGTILSAAVFAARRQAPGEAEAVLAILDNTSISPAERQVIRGSYLSQTGDIAGARALFAEALAQSPPFASPWREAVGLEMACGQPEQALKIAEAARRAGASDERLEAIALQAQALVSASGVAPLEALARLLDEQAETSRWGAMGVVVGGAAAALREGRTLELPELAQLERVAGVFEHFAPLHEALVEAYTVRRMPAERARVASRWAEAMPQSPAAQRAAFEAMRDSGALAQAQFCALRWKEVAAADAVWADAALAEVRLLAGNHTGAADVLAPHLLGAAGSPAELARLLGLAAETHAASGDYEEAWELIAPHLADSPTWRRAAVRLASGRIAEADEAVQWLERVEQALEDATGGGGSASVQTLPEEHLAVASAWVAIGVKFDLDQRVERGRLQLEQLTAGALAQSADAWKALADAAQAAGAPSQAQLAYRRVLALDPRRAPAGNELARLLLASEDASLRAEALTWARVAAEQDPSEATFQAALGRACLESGQLQQAQDAFERALRLDDEHLEATLGLATLLLSAGELETAARWYQRLRPIFEGSSPDSAALREEFAALEAQFGGEEGAVGPR